MNSSAKYLTGSVLSAFEKQSQKNKLTKEKSKQHIYKAIYSNV